MGVVEVIDYGPIAERDLDASNALADLIEERFTRLVPEERANVVNYLGTMIAYARALDRGTVREIKDLAEQAIDCVSDCLSPIPEPLYRGVVYHTQLAMTRARRAR